MDPCSQFSLQVTEGALEGREPSIQDSSPGGWVVGWLGGWVRGGEGQGRHPFPGESSTILYPESEPPQAGLRC